MNADYAQHGRAEQLVSLGRLLLATVAALALLFEPAIAERPRGAVVFGAAYAVWSAAIAVWVARSAVHSTIARIVTHVVDLAVATILVGATQTPVSPLFPLYIFALFSATLRFDGRGVLLTGAASALSYSAVAVAGGVLVDDPAFFATRLVQLAIATPLLAFFRRHYDRLREDLTRLATWPRVVSEQREPLLEAALQNAAGILHAPRVAVAFEEDDEPWLWLAVYDGARLEIAREAPDFPLHGDVPADATFFCDDASEARPLVNVASASRVERFAGAPLAPALVQRLRVRSVLSAPFAGEAVQGRLFVLDRADSTFDDLMLSRVVAQLFASRLDEFAFAAAARGAAVGDERLRLARNLHDTLLQSLTAAGLQIEGALELFERDPAAARRKIHAVQELIARTHTDLRSDIAGLRPRSGAARPPSIRVRLGELPLWVLQQWDIVAAIEVEPPDADVPEPLATEVFRLVNEAIANAAKHAAAQRVSVRVTIEADRVSIVVTDDGRGLPFHGSFDLAALDADDRGPVTLRERIAALGGTLTLESSDRGTTLDMSVPLSRS